ncbi:hypothetical protein C1646_762327 [Rhizophagus diaphanus]|nr:hypothetical protein C1646_762327 [Rhizophagus diaphanus] [Rhizophagus sp. MUCL 43196]
MLAKEAKIEEQEKEFYSKLQIVKSIRFTVTTILAKKNEVVAKEAFDKDETMDLTISIMMYYSERSKSRLNKLKGNIKNSKNNQYIKSFIKYASNSININDSKANPLIISKVYYYYYIKVSKVIDIYNIPKKFLKYLKKKLPSPTDVTFIKFNSDESNVNFDKIIVDDEEHNIFIEIKLQHAHFYSEFKRKKPNLQ